MNQVAGRHDPRIVVTGVGAVSAWGWGCDPFWRGLASGGSAIREAARFDVVGQRTTVAAEVPDPPDEVRHRLRAWPRLSAADRFGLAAAWEAVGQAGVGLDESAGVYFGGSTAGMAEGERWFERVHEGGHASPRQLESHPLNSPGDAIARAFRVTGPVQSLSSACASGALAVGTALEALRAGEVDVALAGGADSLCRLTYSGFNALRAVDARPCRPFRVDREGMSLGEGAGVLVLEREPEALARGAAPLAVLSGAGASCDAYHMTAPHPEGSGAAAAVLHALRDAGYPLNAVRWINAHGTGTPLNDASEWHALQELFGERAGTIPLAAVKGSVGHLLGSSGALEAVATVLVLRAGRIPPTPGGGTVDPDTPVDLILDAARTLSGDGVAVSTSFAFGGSNAALVFSSWAEDRP